MGKKYYISVDGGGTKLLTLLFDDEFRLLSVGKSGAINPNFEGMDAIRAHMLESIVECLEKFPDIVIEQASAAMPGPVRLYEEVLRSVVTVNSFVPASEGSFCLMAGIGKRRGIVALSGTGSGAAYVDHDTYHHVGFWGGLIGDEGSGYDIGLKGISAAIFSSDGRGTKSLLEKRVMESFELEKMWDMVTLVHSAPSQHRLIASVCRLVSDCADEGDLASLQILIHAGKQMALQATALIRRFNLKQDLPVLASGGAWKSNEIMFQTFKQTLLGQYPDLSVSMPLFDPVMGPVVSLAVPEGGNLSEEHKLLLQENFRDFLYKNPSATQTAAVRFS